MVVTRAHTARSGSEIDVAAGAAFTVDEARSNADWVYGTSNGTVFGHIPRLCVAEDTKGGNRGNSGGNSGGSPSISLSLRDEEGRRFKAVYDHTARSDRELSFKCVALAHIGAYARGCVGVDPPPFKPL